MSAIEQCSRTCGAQGPECPAGCTEAGQPACDATVQLRYDYRNRLVEYEHAASGLLVTYRYDAFGRRIAKLEDTASRGLQSARTADGTAPPFHRGSASSSFGSPQETRYFYGGQSMWQVIEEQDAAGVTQATYAYGPYIDEVVTMRRGGEDYFFHADDNFNVVAVTDSSGAVVERYEYDDFGQPCIYDAEGVERPASAIGNPFLFTGREFDAETGLYHYRTRYYDPLAGRFISRDTIGIWGDGLNNGNAQAYGANAPWQIVDPMGTETLEIDGEKWQRFDNESKDPKGSPHQAHGDHYKDSKGNRYYPQKGKIQDKHGKWHDAPKKFEKKFNQRYSEYWKNKGPGPLEGFGDSKGKGGNPKPARPIRPSKGGMLPRGVVAGTLGMYFSLEGTARAPEIPHPPPSSFDHDGDGIPDGWDFDYGGPFGPEFYDEQHGPDGSNPWEPVTPGGDYDNDGIPNWRDPRPYNNPGDFIGPPDPPSDRDGDGTPDFEDPYPDHRGSPCR